MAPWSVYCVCSNKFQPKSIGSHQYAEASKPIIKATNKCQNRFNAAISDFGSCQITSKIAYNAANGPNNGKAWGTDNKSTAVEKL
jgi:hypothetical protein